MRFVLDPPASPACSRCRPPFATRIHTPYGSARSRGRRNTVNGIASSQATTGSLGELRARSRRWRSPDWAAGLAVGRPQARSEGSLARLVPQRKQRCLHLVIQNSRLAILVRWKVPASPRGCLARACADCRPTCPRRTHSATALPVRVPRQRTRLPPFGQLYVS